jgi:hypothetical protein
VIVRVNVRARVGTDDTYKRKREDEEKKKNPHPHRNPPHSSTNKTVSNWMENETCF